MTNNSFGRVFRTGLISAGLIAFAMPALAVVDAVSVVSEPLMLDQITLADGRATHHLVDPSVTHDKVIPGSHVVIVMDYRNTSAQTVDHFVVTNPLHKALMLSDDAGAAYEVSVDGGRTFGKLGALSVSDGKGGMRAAQASDVTGLRWNIPRIAPGASGKLEFHAVVR